MVPRVASTLAEAVSTMGAGVIILVVDVLAMPRADAWGKGPTEEGKGSPVAVDTKVRDNLVLDTTLFKGNQVGQQEVGITQTPEMKIGGGGQRNYGNNFYSNNRAGFGNNQQRWTSQNNGGRGGAFQQRFRGNGDGAPARGPIDADLLHQTVVAVTVAQKVTDVASAPASNGAAGANGQPILVVTSTAVLPQSNKVVEPPVVQGNAKENEGAGPAKKKKEDKEACFRCKKSGHFY
jgi:hypothetical protein